MDFTLVSLLFFASKFHTQWRNSLCKEALQITFTPHKAQLPHNAPPTTTLEFFSGVIAIVSAAVISHPADTLLSKVNKKGAGGEGIMMTVNEHCPRNRLCETLYRGLLPKCVMIEPLTAGQFGIFDTVMTALGASKFHFHNPNAEGGH